VIAGQVSRAPQVRRSPAGVPIARFVLQHRSRQRAAGREREAVCSLQVVASGSALEGAVAELAVGTAVRVSGFLSRADNRQGEYRLVVHADTLEILQGVVDA